MNRKNPEILKSRVDAEFLPFVRKPGRYIGGEINQTRKNPADCDVRVALAFPDVYEIGMSHTGLAIVYDLLNRAPGVACERVFAPWLDAEELMRKISLPLFTLESKAAVRDFDMLGFSLTNELCYTAFLNMIDLAGLPVRALQRTEAHPLIIVGGQIANCAEPLADFADLFFLGQAEEILPEVIALYRQHKQQGHSKVDFLLAAARQFDCQYVPSLYAVEYDGEELKSIRPKAAGVPARLKNAAVEDFENASVPARPVVPFVEAVHDRISIEIMRGCPGRCRFCQASFCRRPIRYRSPDRIVEIARQQYAATGYDTISLLSLSTADYPHLEELIDKLTTYFAPRHVGLSVPSLRVQEQLQLLPKMVTAVRKSGLTIAVEAASPALRKMINSRFRMTICLPQSVPRIRPDSRRSSCISWRAFPARPKPTLRRWWISLIALRCCRERFAGVWPVLMPLSVGWFPSRIRRSAGWGRPRQSISIAPNK
jgi:radical SAM superfamily enzyme YgiQ (UPF0313 family)